MLIRMPGARDYIETGRVSRIGLEDGYVKVMDGQDKMLSRNFNSPEEADAWADEVAKIVNEANTHAFELPPSGKHCLGDSPTRIFASQQTSESSGSAEGKGDGCRSAEKTEPAYLLTSCTSDDFEVRIQFATGRGGDFCRLSRAGALRLQDDLRNWLRVPSFADWQPTEEQIKEAGRALESLPPAALIDPLCVHQMRTALRIWQRIYAAQAKG